MDEEARPGGGALARISRRKMLKRVAAGTAVAWSAPILTSLRTPAFAQYGACSTCTDTACFTGDFIRCSTAPDCFCGRSVDGQCECIVFNGLPPEGAVACTSDADCAVTTTGDNVCVNDTCLGDICQPRCTATGGSAETTSGVNTR